MAYKHPTTGHWVAQTTDHGKRKQIGTYPTKREADAAERAAKDRVPSSRMTVAEWREEWLTTPTWKDSTRRHNAERTRLFAETHGTLRVGAVNRRIARQWIEKHDSTYGALSAMFGAAAYVDDENHQPLVAVNPFSKLVKRTMRRRDLRPEWLTDEDITRLERIAVEQHGEAMGTVVASMIRFAAETGIRPGELYAVEMDDLDPARGELHVRRQATRDGTGPTKNGRERTVVLTPAAHDAAIRAQIMEATPRTVFATLRGRRFSQGLLRYYWVPVRTAFDRPRMVFYELRHYCATHLLDLGVSPEDVAIQLGHTDGGELVRRVYGHPSDRKALDRVREAMNERAA